MKKQATFAERLKEALDLRQMTKADLSRMTGISKSSLTHYEKGDWEGKQDAVYKIAKALGVTEAWLMGFDASMDPAPSQESKQPSELEGLSDLAIAIGRLVDQLPPESRKLLLVQVEALARAIPDPASSEGSPE